MYLILDLETTGIPKEYGEYNENEKYDSSRIVQISWLVADKYLNIVHTRDFIIKRDGFEITNSEIHKITNEISESQGKDLKMVLSILEKDLEQSQYLIGHNIDFDYHILLNHFYRVEDENDIITYLENMYKVCTLESSMEILNLKKYPSLIKLYEMLFEKNFENPHNSMNDVLACYECFKYLIKI